MEKETYTLCLLNRILDQLEPGDVIHLLNYTKPCVVVMILEDGVITDEGEVIYDHRPVRFWAEREDSCLIDSEGFFESEDFDFGVEGGLESLNPGAAIWLLGEEIDLEGKIFIEASLAVLGVKDSNQKFFLSSKGEIIPFDLGEDNYIPTNCTYDLEQIPWTDEGLLILHQMYE